jgi:plasmid stability protein
LKPDGTIIDLIAPNNDNESITSSCETLVANINVRGLSDQTKAALRVRAAKEGMSLEAYARRALQRASMDNDSEPKSLLEQAEKFFGKKHGVELDLPERSTRRQPADFG